MKAENTDPRLATNDMPAPPAPSAGANGRDWFAMSEAQRARVDPTSDYVPADAQIVETTGAHMRQYTKPEEKEYRDTVREVDDATTRQVIGALDRPRKVLKAKVEKEATVGGEMSQTTTVGREPIASDYLPKFEDGSPMPSFGEAYDDCGDDLAVFCDCCGETTVTGRTCTLSKCPRCWASWCRKRSVGIAGRLKTTWAIRMANREDQQFFHHVVFSPPDEWALQSKDTLKRTKQAIHEILDAMDLDAAYFYHAWRGDHEDDEETENDLGEWGPRIGPDTDWEGGVRDELKFSPHFHIIAVGSHVPGGELSKRVHEETGWILARITKGEDSKVSLYDDGDMVSALMYCLSHTSLKTTAAGNHTAQYGYHGDIINQKMTRDADDEHLTITDATHEKMDLLSRAHAPLTLDIPLDSLLCQDERPVDEDTETGAQRADVKSLINIATGDTRTWTPSGGSGGDGGGDGGSGGEQTATAELATPGGTVTQVEEIEHNREGDIEEPETEKCSGRMLHIKRAPEYLGNPDWRSKARHADQLQTTWAEWKDRLDELGVSGG